MKTVAPYGTWNSALTGEYIARASVKLSEPAYHEGEIYWLEGRPAEKGRQTLVRRKADGTTEELLPAPWNARSKVHEYGGGCYCVGSNCVFFCHSDDQQIYQLDLDSRQVTPLTNTPLCRYADLQYDSRQRRLFAVCEDHGAQGEPENRLITLELDNRAGNGVAKQTDVDKNHDFVSSPRLSPCHQWLTYLTWDHPNMPWDASQLWLRFIAADGSISEPHSIAGRGLHQESLFQPQWSPSGELFWVSDCSNWWNLYALSRTDIERLWNKSIEQISPTAVFPHEAEYAMPQWVFNMSTYGFLSPNELFATYTQDGSWHLLHLHRKGSVWRHEHITTDLVSCANIHCRDGKAVFVGASPYTPTTLFEYANGKVLPIRSPAEVTIDSDDVSVGRAISFPTGAQDTAHGFFYPPVNARYEAQESALSPVIVVSHGGPTGANDPSFSYKIQYWTQRGFAVLDVNYRGSTGFGRRYRQALQKQWGVADVEDLSSAAEFVTTQGWVNPTQRIVRGSSAGGYSVLAALTDTTTFNAGVSLYGIGDLETLASDTHKFESRYLDGLIGPYPAQKALYRERSPIHKVHHINCPVLVFQGQEDKVVPPNQAEQMVAAVKAQGLPVAYVLYPNEGHGFRQSDTIAHQLQAELYFYQEVFALQPETERAKLLDIQNWGRP